MDIYDALLAVLLISIIIVVVLSATIVKEEPYTQLYFENHHGLPLQIELNKPYSFSFTVRNMEQTEKNYTYALRFGTGAPFNQGTFGLKHNQSITINESIMFREDFKANIVTVQAADQQIHFWVEPK